MKLDTATPICKVCFNEIKEESFSSFFKSNIPICPRCFRHLKPRVEHFELSNRIKGISLYDYNEEIKTILFNFKACFDYELKDVFFFYQKPFLKLMYRNYVLIPAPSFKLKDEERGFNHVVEMFGCLGLEMVNAIEKTTDIKQADLTKKERMEVGRYLSWNDHIDIKGKNVLFVDDVLTTGSTATSCTNLIKSRGAKKIRFLVMSHTKNPEELSQKAPLK